MIFVVRFLLILIVLRLLVRFVVGLWRHAQLAAREPVVPMVDDLVRDPVCNTFVPRSRAVAARIDGTEQLFCSAACRDRALSAR